MEKRCFRMGVDDFLGKQLTEDPKFSGQDDILNAVQMKFLIAALL